MAISAHLCLKHLFIRYLLPCQFEVAEGKCDNLYAVGVGELYSQKRNQLRRQYFLIFQYLQCSQDSHFQQILQFDTLILQRKLSGVYSQYHVLIESCKKLLIQIVALIPRY